MSIQYMPNSNYKDNFSISNSSITSEAPHIFMSRKDIIDKLKDLKNTVNNCKKERINSFLKSKHLRHYVCERVDMLFSDKLKEIEVYEVQRSLREQPKVSELNQETINSDSDFVTETNSFDNSSDSILSQDPDVGSHKPPSIRFSNTNSNAELDEARLELQALEEEFLEKQKQKTHKVKRSIHPTEEQITEHKTSYRSYVRFASSAYHDEPIISFRKYVVIDFDELNAFLTAQESEPMFSLTIEHVTQFIDLNQGDIRIIYKFGDMERAVVITPLTSGDFKIWKIVCRNLANLRGINSSTTGTLPHRVVAPDMSPLLPVMRKQRKTVFYKQGEITIHVEEHESPTNVIEEISENVTETDESKITESYASSESWDYDFEELEEENRRETLRQAAETSIISYTESEANELNIYDERNRTYTILASLGKTEGLVNLLTKGGIFLKYGRHGKPHLRHIVLTADLRYVE